MEKQLRLVGGVGKGFQGGGKGKPRKSKNEEKAGGTVWGRKHEEAS